MEQLDNTFRYVYSSALSERIQVKIGTLEGLNHKPNYGKLLDEPILRFSGLYTEQCPPLMVCLQVYQNGDPFGLPVSTSYKTFTKRSNWNEWVTLPMLICDLPRTAMLAITILDTAGPGKTSIIGGSSISFFGKNGMFRQGMFDLRVWVDTKPDGNTITKTPGKGKDSNKNQMQRLAKLSKKHRNGQIPTLDWLDRLTFREIEMINEKEKSNSDYLYLLIEFQAVIIDGLTHSIIYYEPDGDQNYTFILKPKLVRVPDSEISQDNLVERKHHRLARSARSGLSDRETKPTTAIRNQLYTMVYRYPPTYQLTGEEQDFIWKYRFYLSEHRKALTKFLKCINWEIVVEVRQALSLLSQWMPMDVEDALELLSPTFKHPTVRRYAISRLMKAPDEDLLLYLVQLVQALKYENFNDIDTTYKNLLCDNEMIQSLESNENHNITDSNYMETATDDTSSSFLSSVEKNKLTNIENSSSSGGGGGGGGVDVGGSSSNGLNDTNSTTNTMLTTTGGASSMLPNFDLASFLIQRACRNPTLANYLYWYLYIECENQEAVLKPNEEVQSMYVKVLKNFRRTLSKGTPEQKQIRLNLEKQQIFIEELVKLVKIVAKDSGNRKKKNEKFAQLLADPDAFRINFADFEPIPFPLDPQIMIKGIIPDRVILFKSALMPSKLTFITTNNEEYVAIFKYGDDLRQDQLILQMITLMDKLLRRENLDLKLTPYRVLASSSKHGFMQFIDSTTVAEVLATDGTIHNFFRKHHPCATAPYGISVDVMDTYIRSCAGYCVITYLLGVGDRHLDNLLLTTSGKLFHIDFGYILGRDPKPMPPAMKLSKEMVEAMGGLNSDHHQEFRKQCYTAYLHLRRHANVLLNLFLLMVDASVPDIALEPDKAVRKVEENLKLSLTDEEAVQHLQTVLIDSLTAVMPALVEHMHKFAQYWRK